MPKVTPAKINQKRKNDMGALVDRLGEVKALIATLCDEENDLKDQLIDTRLPSVDGDLFRATISTSERITLNAEKVKMFLTPAQIIKCQKVAEVTTVRVTARIKS
jgi:hypothetical protein